MASKGSPEDDGMGERTDGGHDKYRELFELVRDGYARVDMEGRIVESNPAFRDMLGYSEKELRKLTYEDITPKKWHAREARIIKEQVLVRDFSDIYEKEYIRKDRSVFPIEIVTYLTKDGKGNPESMWAYVRDISDRKRAEEAIGYRMEFERLIATISSDFINVPSDEVNNEITHVLQLLGEFAGVDRCYIFQFSSDMTNMSNTHEWCSEGIDPAIEQLQGLPMDEYMWAPSRLLKNEVVHVPRVSELGPEAKLEKEEFEREGIKSLIMVPMRTGERTIGFIGFDSVKMEKGWTDEIIGLMRLTGETIANALERKSFEEVLRENEEKFRTLAEQSPNMIFINHQGRVVYANTRCEEVMGYEREEFYSPEFDFLDLIAPESLDLVKEQFGKHAAGKDVKPYEYSLVTKEGEFLKGIITTKLIDFEGDRAILGIITDITEQASVLKALRVSEEKFRTLFRDSMDPVFITTREGRFVELNQAGIELFGFRPEEVLEKRVADLYSDPADRGRYISEIEKRGYVRDFELKLKRKDGSIIDCLLTATQRTGDDGESVWYQGIIRDVTERKAAERALRESEEKYRALVEGSMNGIIIAQGIPPTIAFVNPRMVEILGYSQEELMGMEPERITELVHPDDRSMFFGNYASRIKTGEGPEQYELRGIHRDGSIRWVEVTASRIIFMNEVAVQATFMDVTDRKRSEEVIRESERFLQNVFDAIHDGLSVLDTDLNVVKTNRWMEDMYAEQMPLVGRKCYEVFQRRESPCPWCPSLATIEEGVPMMEIVPFPSAENPRGWIELSSFPVRDEEGSVVNVIEYVKDITERKRAESALSDSEQKYRSLFEEARDGIVLIDVETGIIVDCNPEFERQAGRDVDTLVGMPVWEIRPEDKVERARETFNKVVAEGAGGSTSLEIERPDGTIVPIEFKSTKVTIGGKEYLQSTSRDITERVRADRALRRSERFSRTTIESMLDPLHVVDRDLRVLLHNDRLVGYTSTFGIVEPLLDGRLPDLFPFIDGSVWEEYERVFESGEPLMTTERTKVGDIEVYTETSKIPVLEGGEVTRVITILHDITESKHAERALMESEKRYRDLFDASPEAIVIIDTDGRIVDYNTATATIDIFPTEDIRGVSFADLEFVSEEKLDEYMELFLHLLEGEEVGPIEVRIDSEDGPTWLEIFPGLITTEGEVSGLELICRDITLRKRAEKVIRDSLAEKEVMLKEIHHRVKNNMQVISSMINLQAGYIDGEDTRSVFNESQNRVRSMALIHDKLYQSEDLSRIDFFEYVESLGTHLMQSYGTDPNRIRFDVHGEPVFIGIDRGVPAGLIVNELISNSLKHAFPGGGRGRIEVTLREESGRLDLRVRDDGVGMPGEIDFRKTETLGLELVTTLVSQLEGDIELEGGKGTAFNITFRIEEESSNGG